jgi:hypothetical protein
MLPTYIESRQRAKVLSGMKYPNKDGIRKKSMIMIEHNLENAQFDLILSDPTNRTSNFVLNYTDYVVYFLANFKGPSTLITQSIPIRVYAEMFALRIVIDHWKVESIRYPILEILLQTCPEDRVAALSESLLGQIEAYEHDLIQEPIRTQMKTLLRSYSPMEAVKTI